MSNAKEAKIYAYIGSSGSGKTTRARKRLDAKKRNRTMIWSPKEAIDNYASYYAGSVVCTTCQEVLNILKKAGEKGAFHIVFKPKSNRSVDEISFHAFCKMALRAKNLVVMVDELHTVTKANWSPDGWSELVMMGRAFGMEIFGMSQRPASMDKHFLGNATIINCGRLSYPDDAQNVAKSLGVKSSEMALVNGYMWIERDNLTGKITRG